MYTQYKEKMSAKEGKVFPPLKVPWEVVEACNGFAMDIGGSLMKFLYVDKETAKEKGSKQKKPTGQLCVRSFPHTDLVNGDAFEFLKENVCFNKSGDEMPPIYGTGFGTSVLGSQFKEMFGVEVRCEEESTCFCRALAYMINNMPREDMLFQFGPKEVQSVMNAGKSTFNKAQEAKSKMGLRTSNQAPISPDGLWFCRDIVAAAPDKPLAVEESMFPCILVMCGSATGAMALYEDGTYDILQDTSIGGKHFIGLGSVLTDAQNYNELMALAEKGDNKKVDITTADCEQMTDTSDSQFPRTVSSFAKVNTTTKDSMNTEDIARAFLVTMGQDLMNMGMGSARIVGARHVFYTGGFVTAPLVQSLMYRNWVQTWSELAAYDTQMAPVEIHFLQHSGHMGAFGALLANLENSSS